MQNIWDVAINATGFVGVGMLAWPAVYAAKYASLRSRLARLGPVAVDGADKQIYEQALREFSTRRELWTTWFSVCLVGGTLLSAGSYLLALTKALVAV